MMSSSAITVILPCLNEAESLPAILAVLPNGYRALVVDNNSTDGTVNAQTSKIMYIASDDGGTTWSTPLQLTGTFNSNAGFPQQNKIGDYHDIESDDLGASVIVSATFASGRMPVRASGSARAASSACSARSTARRDLSGKGALERPS